MANALYDAGREAFLKGLIAIDTDTIVAYLIDTGAYTVNLSTHDFLDDVPAGSRIAGPVTLGSKTTTAGVFNCAAFTFSSVSGASVEAIILVKSTGVESTSRLIAYIDTATGLPFTPSGGNVTVTPDTGANKVFKL